VSGRLEKIAMLAGLLSRATPDEIEIAVVFLSGSYRQQKLNIGYAALQAASADTSGESATLELAEVDAAFERISHVAQGKGSTAERQQLLRELFTRATAAEQEFLFRRVIG